MYVISLEVGNVHTKNDFRYQRAHAIPFPLFKTKKKEGKKERGKHTPIDRDFNVEQQYVRYNTIEPVSPQKPPSDETGKTSSPFLFHS